MAVYRISYEDLPGEEFKSQRAVTAYLNGEEKAWSAMLDVQQGNLVALNVRGPRNDILTLGRIVETISELRNFVGDVEVFNHRADGKNKALALPPPSKSPEGAAILSLFGSHRSAAAIYMLEAFMVDSRSLRVANGHQNNMQKLEQGRVALQTISAVLSVVPNAGDLQQMKVGAVQAENELARVHELIDDGAAANDAHTEQFGRLFRVFRYLEERRDRKFMNAGVSRAQKFDGRMDEFEEMIQRYRQHMELDAPVVLWGKRAGQHRTRSVAALKWFFGLGVATVAAAIVTAVAFGDEIAASFSREVCTIRDGVQTCEIMFNYKGPVLVASLLVTFSVLLWATRLQYRMFLSERHLSLDAEEKTAFAKSFAAITQDKSIAMENESIVLAALFRPTPDGIIKDEEGGLDPSISAAVAKFLSRS
ncbi:DUF6161 domain-containing protein [Gymnodinialimonas ceratoperidinii]|uniref:DUF6161 domain-containing protein n=1 Tax=Gymnodinialimonas ceratoperidinii TaxID=2856823 RepID=A0A8F6TTN5_9RHOB|nr:DUF6161 domain-containing protein [Gymnodinialimonas ceratoperidinii]QXT38741.1 hypothetical protein KYE46_12455 [Gymnodinialimonas ceratoperidinii]